LFRELVMFYFDSLAIYLYAWVENCLDL